MRRAEKEILNPVVLEEILQHGQVCHIALSDGKHPYIVPVCYGYYDRILYFHCAPRGKKIDILTANPNVCFEISTDIELQHRDTACSWTMNYRSIIGSGTAEIVANENDKLRALAVIMQHYSGQSDHSFDAEALKKTTVVRIMVNTLTGKQSGIQEIS